MPAVPMSIRVALGLAVTVADEARKLPEKLPSAITAAPMIAVSTAMQASLRIQQEIAVLASRGDQVLALLHPPSEEPPAWATFDDLPAADGAETATQQAAFDRIDYEHTGFTEAGDEASRWDAVGAASDDAATGASADTADQGPRDPADTAAVTSADPGGGE